MLAKLTNVTAADSSGVQWLHVIHLYGGSHRRWTRIGAFVKGAIRRVSARARTRALSNKRLRRLRVGNITRGLVIRARFASRYADNTRRLFFSNAVILLRSRQVFWSTRARTPLPREVHGAFPLRGQRAKYLQLFQAVI